MLTNLILIILAINFFSTNCYNFSAYEATISTIQDAILNQNVKCSEIIQAHYDRIKLNDKRGMYLNSIIQINPKAIIQAKQYDSIQPFGKLFCVPIIAKDNFDFANLITTAGCAALESNYVEENAFMIQKLLDEGAILLAKANMAELALQGLMTISTVTGKTLNLYTPNRTTFGSSGGTATAIAASFGVIGLGTDTEGSIVLPASAQYLYGLRPNKFRSELKKGVFPLCEWQDIAGLIMRNIEDLELVWSIFNQTEINIQYNQNTTTLKRSLIQNNNEQIETKGTIEEFNNKLNIGIISDCLINYHPIMIPSTEVIDLVNNFIEEISNINEFGEILQIPAYLESASSIGNTSEAQGDCYNSLGKKYINQYMAQHNFKCNNCTLQNIEEIYQSQVFSQYFSNGFLTQASDSSIDIESQNCSIYANAMNTIRDVILAKMKQNNIDLIIYPSGNQVAPLLSQVLPTQLNFELSTNDTLLEGYQAFAVISAYSGFPSLNIPIGQTNETKTSFGMIVLGQNETNLIEFAKIYNSYFNKRIPGPIL